MSDFVAVDAAWERYKQRYDRYVRAADAVASIVRGVAANVGIRCAVDARAKTPAEFLKKSIRRGGEYLTDPWRKMTDKAGARAVVPLLEDVDNLREAIANDGRLVVLETIDTRGGDPARLDYRGLHLQVAAPAEVDDDETVECELQLRTEAQHLWAPVSHRFLYKPLIDLPYGVQRSLYRLVSLIEMFDEEVQRAVQEIRQLPGYTSSELLDLAERHFLSLVSHPDFDPSLSLQVLDAVSNAIKEEESATYSEVISQFVIERREDLAQVLDEYGPSKTSSARYTLFSQPEVIIFLERLERAPIALAEAWRSAELSESILAATSSVWGKPV